MKMLGKEQMYIKPRRSLGQNFLINERVARAEAAHAYDKNVLELGAGYGMLTKELCKNAKKVVAVERDSNLCLLLKSELHSKKLKLLNSDFFSASEEELELKDTDIMIANIPYNLSSKTIEWLSEHSMQAVLCLQKEFVDHMLAACNTQKYSKLSVITALTFSVTKIMEVPRGNFRPQPRVDSAIVYIKPKAVRIDRGEREMLALLMQHKKKKLRNAIIDSHSHLGMGKSELAIAAERMKHRDERVFTLSPGVLLETARELSGFVRK